MVSGVPARARFPSHRILAEEFGAHQAAGEQASTNEGVSAAERTDGAHHRWIFDPIDGTTNYAHGLPIFCASLAVEVDDVLTAGAVYDPTPQRAVHRRARRRARS